MYEAYYRSMLKRRISGHVDLEVPSFVRASWDAIGWRDEPLALSALIPKVSPLCAFGCGHS